MDSKPIVKSTTCQASVIAGILGSLTLLRAFGVEIDIGENQVAEIVAAFGIIFAAGVAFYGRMKAKTLIK